MSRSSISESTSGFSPSRCLRLGTQGGEELGPPHPINLGELLALVWAARAGVGEVIDPARDRVAAPIADVDSAEVKLSVSASSPSSPAGYSIEFLGTRRRRWGLASVWRQRPFEKWGGISLLAASPSRASEAMWSRVRMSGRRTRTDQELLDHRFEQGVHLLGGEILGAAPSDCPERRLCQSLLDVGVVDRGEALDQRPQSSTRSIRTLAERLRRVVAGEAVGAAQLLPRSPAGTRAQSPCP